MATYHKYICPDCGYEIWANPQGFDALRSGLLINFRCDNCEEIVSISPSEMEDFWIECPECGERVTSTWNPIDGKCPKCNSELKDTEEIMMAD